MISRYKIALRGSGSMGFPRCGLAVLALAGSLLLVAGCARDEASSVSAAPSAANTAPAPPAIPQHDPAAAPVERAAPPTLQPVALGKFVAANPQAQAATGDLTIEDTSISGTNGANFVTERVALVSGDDQYSAGARFADAMMIEPRLPVELRHVVDETRPTGTPADASCGAARTGYLALAKVMEGDTEVLKVMALSGEGLPAASATDVKLCVVGEYRSAGK